MREPTSYEGFSAKQLQWLLEDTQFRKGVAERRGLPVNGHPEKVWIDRNGVLSIEPAHGGYPEEINLIKEAIAKGPDK